MPSLRETPRAVYLTNCPRFVFGESGDLTLSLPSMPREYTLQVVGGDIEANSAMRASFIVRRDELWTFALRFFESEWVALQAFITYAQTGALFTYYPDSMDALTSYQVRLFAPAIGTKYVATPDGEYPVVQNLSITIVTNAVSAPDESGDDLPVGLVFDYDVDDAIYVDTPHSDFFYHGIIQIPNRVTDGVPLTSVEARAGFYGNQTDLHQHALARAFGSSNNNPMEAITLAGIHDLDGLTLWAVHRPGAGVGHGFPFILRGDDAGDDFKLGIGIVSGVLTIGGWRHGHINGDTGESFEGWGGTYFFEPENYPTHGVPYNVAPDFSIQESFPVRDEDNIEPGLPFTITVIRINQFGQVTMYNNGVKLAYGFTANPLAPYSIRRLVVISSAGGSLDLGGGQAWEWTRTGAYGRWLTDLEVKNMTRVLGRRYNITVA